MRIESRIYEYTVKIFEVGETVYTHSNRCDLDHPGKYKVIKFHDCMGFGDGTLVDVETPTGEIKYGRSTAYLSDKPYEEDYEHS